MKRQQKSKIQFVVICGLLILSSFDICDGRKTASSKSKSKSSGSSSSGRVSKPNTQQSYVNPASLSYSGVAPNAPQPKKPSAPQQPSFVAPPKSYNTQQQAAYPQQTHTQNSPPIGWNVNNQPKPNVPPYPANNQQFAPRQNPPQYSQYPNQGPPPAYSQNPSNIGQANFNQPPPAYSPGNQGFKPQQPAYQPQPNYNQQPGHQQTNYGHQQPAYQPQPNYAPQPAYSPAGQPGGFAQQPQVVNNYYPGGTQQQSGGPGILKTALVAGAAGVGGAALYNAFNKNDDPKTTVIVINNGTQSESNPQPAAPAAATQPPQVSQETIQNPPQQQYPQQQYPQPQYPQQQYPQQQYPQQQYDPNNPQAVPQQYDQSQMNAFGQQQQYNNQQQFPQNPVPLNPDGSVSIPPPQPIDNSTPAIAVSVDPTQLPPAVADIASAAEQITESIQNATSAESTTQQVALETSSAASIISEISTSSTTMLANESVPSSALNTRGEEIVEQKNATIVHQSSPQTDTKGGNGASNFKISSSVALLSLIAIAIKPLL